jgi:hypothetical protein
MARDDQFVESSNEASVRVCIVIVGSVSCRAYYQGHQKNRPQQQL